MKFYHKIVTVLALIFFSSAGEARLIPCPGQWAFQFEYLYLKPSVDNPFFALNSISPTTGLTPLDSELLANPLNYHSAYRLEGLYGFCNSPLPLHFQIRGTYLNAKDKRNIQAPFLFPTQGSPQSFNFPLTDSAEPHTHCNFYMIETLFGLPLFNECPFFLIFGAGLQYANINVKDRFLYTSATIPPPNVVLIERNSSTWCLGPELAIDAQYTFFRICNQSIAFVLNGRTSLLASKIKGNLQTSVDLTSDLNSNARNEGIFRIVPSFDLRFGLNWNAYLSCIHLAIEAGYEFISYTRALDGVTTTTTTNAVAALPVTFNDYSNLDMHGPYIALSLGF